jgi:hypothetical protein
MEHIWRTIKQDVQNKHWDTNGLQELFNKQLDVILTSDPITFDSNRLYSTIRRNGDIVVGFYLDDTARISKSLELTIGGQPLPDLEVQPGKFAYIFENTHVYPIISVAYSELHITTDDCSELDGLYVIYALIKDQYLRREIATTAQVIKLGSGKIACFRGNFGYLHHYPDVYNEIPNMSTL